MPCGVWWLYFWLCVYACTFPEAVEIINKIFSLQVDRIVYTRTGKQYQIRSEAEFNDWKAFALEEADNDWEISTDSTPRSLDKALPDKTQRATIIEEDSDSLARQKRTRTSKRRDQIRHDRFLTTRMGFPPRDPASPDPPSPVCHHSSIQHRRTQRRGPDPQQGTELLSEAVLQFHAAGNLLPAGSACSFVFWRCPRGYPVPTSQRDLTVWPEELDLDATSGEESTSSDDCVGPAGQLLLRVQWKGFGHEEDFWEWYEPNCRGNIKAEKYIKNKRLDAKLPSADPPEAEEEGHASPSDVTSPTDETRASEERSSAAGGPVSQRLRSRRCRRGRRSRSKAV
ncbi:hypothetical protein PAPYR_1144 [Paratrimastix pyriformis]|uniref:Chromo domain-containing protein n=1 Tax=Paratrimastix pyriformis TaxID=342808 RepID=A0ABQ8UTM1_9EUKA|nr:hypothetical protein PAPYR_1144 [Paratrimastix pyriformis]